MLNTVTIGFDDDITCVKDDDGNYDRYKEQIVSGLYMIDTDNVYLYIKGISEKECERICLSILKDGFCDLSDSHHYKFLEDEE